MLVVQSYEEEESESDDFDVVIPAAATRKFPTPKAQPKSNEFKWSKKYSIFK